VVLKRGTWLLALLWAVSSQSIWALQDQDQLLKDRFQQNSTAKKRVSPQGLSEKAGTAIAWQSDLATAEALSLSTGKPIFWYVPTLQRTFMDRKDVIDQYLKSGPFSWPAIIRLINENYVPLLRVPDAESARKFELLPYRFIEPGFVVIQAGKALQTADRLTTLHPRWMFQLMAKPLNKSLAWDELASSGDRSQINQAWRSFESRQPIPVDFAVADQDRMELQLLLGMQLFRQGRHQAAKEFWAQASTQFPNHPLAWKASMEAQGIGPFVRGFEVFGTLTSRQQLAGIESLGSAAPAGTFSQKQLWEASSRFLLDNQREDGGFFDSDYDFGGIDSMPNIHMAVTAICGWAMLQACPQVNSQLRDQLQFAVAKAAAFCADDNNLNPKDRDELLWAEAYRLRFLSALHQRADGTGGQVKFDVSKELLDRLAKQLEDLQSGNGTWFHEYPNSFVTATALIALKDASLAGAQVNLERVKLGLKRLESQRFANGAYPYAVRRANSRQEAIEASSGRIPLCSYARFLWDQEDDQQLATAAEIGLQHHALLAKAVKYDNHTDTHAFGGFFFWYDMHARSEAIAAVVNPQQRKKLAEQQQQLILALPELDGCFVDSHELGRCYGTAMALLSLYLMTDTR
jgi:hypothetical protein